MFDYLITGGTLVENFSKSKNRFLTVANGKIQFLNLPEKPLASEEIKAEGYYICPGLIDMHVHGGNGADALDCSPDSLEIITSFHGRQGTTGIILTVAAAPFSQMIMSLKSAAGHKKLNGSQILGFHLEGPFLNPSFCGALNSMYFCLPDLKKADQLREAGGVNLKIITLAPELPGCRELIRVFSSSGIIVSLGHSSASYETVLEAGKAGLTHFTHIFNAMAGIHHRKPGPASAAIARDIFTAEVIADGYHVHPALLKMLWLTKGKRLALASDAIWAAGLPEGLYRHTGQNLQVSEGKATVANGRLAGNTTALLNSVKIMISLVGLTLPQAIYLASTSPAAILGLSSKGRLAQGYDADLLILDSELKPHLVMVGGRIIYQNNS